MGLFLDEKIRQSLKDKDAVVDNDFLDALLVDEDLFIVVSDLLFGHHLTYNQITAFEFLRDLFIPKLIKAREDLLSRDRFFPLTDHQTIYEKTKDNAIILSKIYAHKQCKSPSFVDIFLAARLMMLGDRYVLITGNKKDYPNFIFDTRGVIVKEEKDGALRNYSILSFNSSKFDKCFEELGKVK